ncbi:MAG: branched-chain amino acid ABC transporter permease [Gammaproteobacteria bacterium]|nr:branched-chain amino acid ABC transporter permease [Gammaproteobacteria bacterium]
MFDGVFWMHVLVCIVVLALAKVLPEYHNGIVARILVLTVYALGYNLLFGYTGLLSLGHALYFAAGMYGAGMTVVFLDWSIPAGFAAGVLCSLVLSLLLGSLALRTIGVAFMIVTMMFAQAGFLVILYFNEFTRGDEGFVISQAARNITLAGTTFDLSDPSIRYSAAWLLFAIGLVSKLLIVRSRTGRVLVSVRENEERSKLLGYNAYRYKLTAFVLSAVYAGVAGAAYAILFGYAGATFASIQYSILPLLWVLLGGAGVVLGPLVGTVTMFYLIDYLSEITSAYLLFVGLALVLLILLAPRGLLGLARNWRSRWFP